MDDVMNEWHSYVVEQRDYDLNKIIAEEKLKPEDNSFSNTTKLVYVVKKDSPITPPQRRYLAALVEKHNINLEIPVEEMTKSMASRQIDTIIAQYGK